MKISVFNIDYDIDEEDGIVDLPTSLEFEITDPSIQTEDEIEVELADMISNKTGWCVNGFEYKKI